MISPNLMVFANAVPLLVLVTTASFEGSMLQAAAMRQQTLSLSDQDNRFTKNQERSQLAQSVDFLHSLSKLAENLAVAEQVTSHVTVSGQPPVEVIRPNIDEDLNKILVMVWPHVSKMVEDLLRSYLLPVLHDAHPLLSDLKFNALDLQSDYPDVQVVEVRKTGGRDLRLTLKFRHKVTRPIELGLGLASFGARNALIAGEIVIRFDHLLDKLPLVGGIAIQMAELPTIDYELTGLAAVAGIPGVKDLIRDAIDSVIADHLMGPNRFAYSWSSIVDISKLRHPPPAGILRVVVGDGVTLGSALHLRKEREGSDPAQTDIAITLGGTTRRVSMRTEELLADGSAAFMVWDEGQRVHASVWDGTPPILLPGLPGQDSMSLEVGGRVGTIPRFPVREALRLRSHNFTLSEHEPPSFDSTLPESIYDSTSPSPVGYLSLAFEMLQLVPICSGDVFVLKVHVDKLIMPYDQGSQPAKVVVEVAGQQAVTTRGSPSAKQNSVVAEELQALIRRMAEKNIAATDIAQILDVGVPEVNQVLQGGATEELRVHPSHVEMTFDSTLYLPLPRSLWEKQGSMVDISVLPTGKEASPVANVRRGVTSLVFGDSSPQKLSMANVKCTERGIAYKPVNMKGQRRTTEPTVAACQDRCASTAGCAHFSYWPGWPNGGCHLQDSEAAPAKDRQATSGPPRCLGMDAWISLSMLGTQAPTHTEA